MKDQQPKDLNAALKLALKKAENPESLRDVVSAGIVLSIFKLIKKDIERGNYSFWMSCTAP